MAYSNIITSFTFEELIKDIMLYNQLRVKELKDKDGKTEFLNYAITRDDDDLIDVLIKNGVSDISNMVKTLTTSLTNAVSDTTPYSITIPDNGYSNPNIRHVLSNAMKQYIVSVVLSQWYEIKGMADDYKVWTNKAITLKEYISNELLIDFIIS